MGECSPRVVSAIPPHNDRDQWVDDGSRNIHPCGWASEVGHPLESPLTPEEVKYWGERGGCPTAGCRGVITQSMPAPMQRQI